jgi:hypothetical protein
MKLVVQDPVTRSRVETGSVADQTPPLFCRAKSMGVSPVFIMRTVTLA